MESAQGHDEVVPCGVAYTGGGGMVEVPNTDGEEICVPNDGAWGDAHSTL